MQYKRTGQFKFVGGRAKASPRGTPGEYDVSPRSNLRSAASIILLNVVVRLLKDFLVLDLVANPEN